MLMLTLAACLTDLFHRDDDPDFESGSVAICLGGEAVAANNTADTGFDGDEWHLHGIVADADARAVEEYQALACTDAPASTLTLTDDDGVTWWLGWSILDRDGAASGPAFNPGDSLSIDVFAPMSWGGQQNGLKISDRTGFRLIAQAGGLNDETSAPIKVTAGAPVARRGGDCGAEIAVESKFTADDSVSLPPGEEGDVTVAGSTLTARNVSHWMYDETDNVECSHISGPNLWAVWR